MDIPNREQPPRRSALPPSRRGWRSYASRLADGGRAAWTRWRGLKRREQALIALGLVLLVTGLVFLRQHSARLAELVIGTVERGDIEDSVTALGNLQPLNYVDVGAQVSGQLYKLHVEVGDEVKAGDLLAEIDAKVQSARVAADQAQLANVKAQLADKEAQLVLARRQFERQKRLKAENATSTEAYQSAEAQLNSARAQIDSLSAQVQQAESTLRADEVTLSYSKIYAPMPGTIASITARQGQTLNATQQAPTILQIADLSKMTVWTQVSEADIVRLKPGMEAYFMTLGNPDRRWHGRLRQIMPTPTITNNVVLYTALFDIDNPKKELMTQMSAQVFFVAASAKNVLTVPVSALKPVRGKGKEAASNGPGKPYRVTVLGPAGTLSDKTVRVGVMNRVSAEIVAGLEEGDRIVTGKRSTDKPRRSNGARQPGGMAPPHFVGR